MLQHFAPQPWINRADPPRRNIDRILQPLPEQLQTLAAKMQKLEEQLRPRSS